MSKTLRQYLAESERTYNYRIKTVGEMPADFLTKLKAKLEQFDPENIGDVKTTPIQAKPADFPAFENDKVSSFDVKLRYPAIEPQIKQIARLLGWDENRIIMQTAAFDNSVDEERAAVEKLNKNLLTDTDYPAPTPEQKALSADYSADPFDHAVLKNSYRSNFTVAGGKTKPSETTNDLKMGDDSPMTKMAKRPPKPATGAQPKG